MLENSTLNTTKIYQLAKELAVQLPECQGSSASAIIVSISMLAFFTSAMIVAGVAVDRYFDFQREKYKWQTRSDWNLGVAMDVVMRTKAQHSDAQLKELKKSIDAELLVREFMNSGGKLQIIPADIAPMFDAVLEGARVEAAAAKKYDVNTVTAGSDTANESDDNGDSFEMVGAAEEGRALLAKGA